MTLIEYVKTLSLEELVKESHELRTTATGKEHEVRNVIMAEILHREGQL